MPVTFNWNPAPNANITVSALVFNSSAMPASIVLDRDAAGNIVTAGQFIILSGSNSLNLINYSNAQSDADAAFVNNSWRIGANATANTQQSITGTNVSNIGPITISGQSANILLTNAIFTGTAGDIIAQIRYRAANGNIFQVPPAAVSWSSPPSSVTTAPAAGGGTTTNLDGSTFQIQHFGVGTPDTISFIDTVTNDPQNFICQSLDAQDTRIQGNLQVDGETLLGNTLIYNQTGTPATPGTIAGYIRIEVGGANAYLPYYQ